MVQSSSGRGSGRSITIELSSTIGANICQIRRNTVVFFFCFAFIQNNIFNTIMIKGFFCADLIRGLKYKN